MLQADYTMKSNSLSLPMQFHLFHSIQEMDSSRFYRSLSIQLSFSFFRQLSLCMLIRYHLVRAAENLFPFRRELALFQFNDGIRNRC